MFDSRHYCSLPSSTQRSPRPARGLGFAGLILGISLGATLGISNPAWGNPAAIDPDVMTDALPPLTPDPLTPNPLTPPLPDTPAPDSPAAVAPNPTISHLVIRLGERRVYAHQGDTVLHSYPIAVGRQGWETPTGEFAIFQMLENPAWEHPWNGTVIPPGPDNPLGDRWIGFWSDGTNVIGFHGTPAEELVGQAVSHGCIRMKNNDVRALFEQVTVGTPVRVQP